MVSLTAIVDTGPLCAAVDTSESDHKLCLQLFERTDLAFVIPTLVVAEATYLIGDRLGSQAESKFLAELANWDVEAPALEDWARMAELVDQYSNFPLGGTDASVIALAERLDCRTITTLDHRHMGSVRPRHCESFELLPK